VEWLRQPMVELKLRTSERASESRTQATHPRTFSDIKPWEDFEPGVNRMLAELQLTTHTCQRVVGCHAGMRVRWCCCNVWGHCHAGSVRDGAVLQAGTHADPAC
jgi:hypothetical protein